MAQASHETIEIFEGDTFSPIQCEIIESPKRKIAASCGRRFGKSHAGSRKLIKWVLLDMVAELEKLERGEREQVWAGVGLSKTVAQDIPVDVLYWVVAPRTEHLSQIRGYLLTMLINGPGKFLRHPQFPDWLNDRNRQLWLWMDGICARIDFIPASSPAGLVSKGLHGAWIDEAGFVPNDRYGAFAPMLWEHRAKLLATGTPSLGNDHWFTKLCVSGLSEGHEREDPEIAKPDDEVQTFVADTIHHAFNENARREAMRDEKFWGAVWAAQWIYADWRTGSLRIFREWSNKIHLVNFSKPRSNPLIGTLPQIGRIPYCTVGDHKIFDPPTTTYGIVDWSGGTAPGAAVIVLAWKDNPISSDDPRPLLVVVQDHEGHEAYTSAPRGWWTILHGMDTGWGVDRWIADPHSPELIKQMKKAGIWADEGAHQDKQGRISIIAALLHHDDEVGVVPALYVSKRCQHTQREISNYRWRRTQDGRASNKPKDYDDHCTDCLAMLAAEVYSGGGVIIGGKQFG
jgi:hypothetical protein